MWLFRAQYMRYWRNKMSIIPKENIEVIAQCIGINNLSSDVALDIAPDVEYRLREIMQVILLFMLKLLWHGAFVYD